jgi:hypothetical protein
VLDYHSTRTFVCITIPNREQGGTMVDSSDEEEEAPSVVKRNYKLPKKRRFLSRHLHAGGKQKKKKESTIAIADSNDSDTSSGDELPIAQALRRSPAREPLRQIISPNTVIQQKAKRSSTMNTVIQQKAKRSSTMNQFSIKLPETGEDVG